MMAPDAATSHVLLQIAWWILIAFGLLAVLCASLLIGMRLVHKFLAPRREAEAAAVRSAIIAVVVGEEPEASQASAQLRSLRGRAGLRAHELLAGMLPKVRGDAKTHLLEILRGRGAEEEAVRHLGSARRFTRCRGAFSLGAMGSVQSRQRLIAMLDDRSPLVRRVVVRALGMLGDPKAADDLLDTATFDPSLLRDLTVALVHLGPGAAAALRARVDDGTFTPDDDDRAAPLAATVLGLTGNAESARSLAAALDSSTLPLKVAAARALGQLDSPVGVPALKRALGHPSSQVRLAAAESLGRLGALDAIPDLIAAVDQGHPTVARTAAAALLSMGGAGRTALRNDRSPYAVEATAIDALRGQA